MEKREKRLVIFDVDGTLYRAELVSFPAYRKLAGEFGFAEPSEALMRTFFGENFQVIAEKLGLSDDPEVSAAFLRRIEQVEYDLVKPCGALFDGVYAQLERLYREGYTLALCSMGLQSYVERMMECTGIGRFISAYRVDDGVHTKSEMCAELLAELPHRRAVFVGDRRHDRQAAADNGLGFVGCLYGFVPGEVEDAPVLAAEPGELCEKIEQAFALLD